MFYEYGWGRDIDSKTALHWFQKSANNNYASAQMLMSSKYNSGTDIVQKNAHKSAEWAIRAAANGDPNAQYIMAENYCIGNVVEKNLEKCFELSLAAAKHGMPMAKKNVGACYLMGFGVEKSMAYGMMWLIMATGDGIEDAKLLLYSIKWNEILTPEQFDEVTIEMEKLNNEMFRDPHAYRIDHTKDRVNYIPPEIMSCLNSLSVVD